MPLPTAATLQQRYRIVRTIGSGGMGTVYLAEDMRLGGRLCAVKEHRPDPSLDAVDLAKLRRQFEQREAGILAALDHPCLPRVVDYFTEDGNDYLAMDYVAGDNLHVELIQHIRAHGRPLPEKVVLLWADQVLDALHYLHSRPTGAIIHRDIKPANIILTSDGRIKLVDFGLAKLVTPTASAAASRSIQLLTPEYAPPEQYITSLGPMDERSDIFSFGATLYHLLTGESPPSAAERAFGAAAMLPARERSGEVSEHTSALLMRACALKKEDRIGSATELRGILNSRIGPAESIEPFQTPPRIAIEPIVPVTPPVNVFDPQQTRIQVRLMETDQLPDVLVPEEWCEVPAGPFLMGSTDKDPDAKASERPQCTVDLPRFWIGKFPITYGQYRVFLEADDGYHDQRWWHEPTTLNYVRTPGQQRWTLDRRPAENVSWHDAMAFCRWLSHRVGQDVRLPIEPEWEKAARGTDGRRFPWGDAYEPGRANVGKDWLSQGLDFLGCTSDVGSYDQGNPYGIEDMCGNVWEWTTSLCSTNWFAEQDYPYEPNDSRRHDIAAPPHLLRMVRGGSWYFNRVGARAASRSERHPTNRHSDVGFRVVISAPTPVHDSDPADHQPARSS